MRHRLDKQLVSRGLAPTRSQAEGLIKLGEVEVNGALVMSPSRMVSGDDMITVKAKERYVSRAGLKLASIAEGFKLDFKDKTVLDVGSSTGGFTDYAIQHGAGKVIAVDVGTEQMHPALRLNPKVELHEQTDIRSLSVLSKPADIVVIDVSFISLREILPTVAKLVGKKTQIVAMVKPQFEAASESLKHKGVIKNDAIRRKILQNFEQWVGKDFLVQGKSDSKVAGAKGNLERFYLLRVR